jgi:hypothetical protein
VKVLDPDGRLEKADDAAVTSGDAAGDSVTATNAVKKGE